MLVPNRTIRHEIRQTLTVELAPAGIEGVLAYTCKKEEGPKTEEWEGFCNVGDEPNPKNLHPWARDESHRVWHVIPQPLLDHLARWGWEGETGDFLCWKTMGSDHFFFDAPHHPLVLVDQDCHMLFDAFKQPLPVGMRADYIEWQFDDATYDLDNAMRHLRSHPHVKDLSRERIPSYNADDGRTESMSFTWCPDIETYRKAWAQCLVYADGFPSPISLRRSATKFPRAVRDLDLLGLKVAGCTK
jgi:hypothetical protein